MIFKLDVRGSVHHRTILTVKTQQDATAYQNFIIPYFKWSSTCFGRHTAHHQKPKTAHVALGFAYVEGCRTCRCWTLSGSICVRYLTKSKNYTSDNRPRMQNQRLRCSFRLLMMGGVSPETCWASFKIRNNKILIYCCILLGLYCKNIQWYFWFVVHHSSAKAIESTQNNSYIFRVPFFAYKFAKPNGK